MAFIQCDFFSEVLGVSVSLNVILPQAAPGCIGLEGRIGREDRSGLEGRARDGRHPVLFLLHGLSDDHTVWMRRTAIERYALRRGLAVVMPGAGRSFYADMARGPRYWTFVSEELPAVARAFFPLSTKREETFVAGNSMGGYGAFKLALRRPELFAAAASLSGALDAAELAGREEAGPFRRDELREIFGDPGKVAGGKNDLFHLARRAAESGQPLPRLWQCCGTEDELYEANLRFRDLARELSLDLTFEEHPAGHNWAYWDQVIPRVLDWL